MTPLRIVSWNIENLAGRVAQLPEIHRRLGEPDVLCLQEARIRARDAEAIAAMTAALPGYVCHWSLNRDPVNVTFRGGRAYGVVSYLRASLGPWRAEVPEWDREGRLVISHRDGIGIGNVYAVNGTSKRYFDHDTGAWTGDRHAFKRRFQQRVLERAGELRTTGGVVIAGDWNVSQTRQDTYPRLRTEEPHARARAELAAHVRAAGMVDVYRRLHPEGRDYTWFNPRARGLDAARVDFVLVSEELVPSVCAATILSQPEDRDGSDHAPLVVEIALESGGVARRGPVRRRAPRRSPSAAPGRSA